MSAGSRCSHYLRNHRQIYREYKSCICHIRTVQIDRLLGLGIWQMIAPNSDDATKQLQGWGAGRYRPWRLVAIVASMIMELSWLTLWYVLLFQSRADISYWKAFAVLGLMFFSSYLLVFWMDSIHIKLLARRIMPCTSYPFDKSSSAK